MKKIFYKGRFVFFPLIAIAFLSLVSYVVMILWNNLLPEILGVKTITFWQAMGIFILSKILFGFGKGGGRMGSSWKRRRMEERVKRMTPEEREQFKEKMQNWRCSSYHPMHPNSVSAQHPKIL
ncbi:hypothetical protein [Daejeonella lutea]|nr:hypothetical protein [Daejeonella lutea]